MRPIEFFKKYQFPLLLFAAYGLLAVIVTYPLIFKFSSSVYNAPEFPGDNFRLLDNLAEIYDLWWQKQVFLHGGSPNFIPKLGLDGVTLHRYLPYAMVLANNFMKWVTIAVNEVFAFNLLNLLSFPLSAIVMYFLAFHVTKNRWASILAGFVYAFSPLHRRYAHEWVGLAQWQWLPLYVLSLLRLDETKTLKWGFLTGLTFAITFIESYYFGYFAIFLTLGFVLFKILQVWRFERKFYLDRKRLMAYVTALLVILILTLPITAMFFKQSRLVEETGQSEIGGFSRDNWERFAFDLSARPWFYVLPDVNHPVLGKLTVSIHNWIAQHPPYFITEPFIPREHSLFLGWSTLLFSLLVVGLLLRGLIRTRERSGELSRLRRFGWLFLFLGVLMMVFSAPPFATISLHKIYFPSYFLNRFFPMFRAYARAGVLVLLCFSILAAFGFQWFLGKLPGVRAKIVFGVLVFGLIFFEFLDFPPFRNEYIGPDPAHEWLAAQPGDFAVVEYYVYNNRPLLQQRVHQKRLINPARWAALEIEEVVKGIDTPASINQLKEWGVRYLVYYSSDPKHLIDNRGYLLVASFPEDKTYIFEVVGLRE